MSQISLRGLSFYNWTDITW